MVAIVIGGHGQDEEMPKRQLTQTVMKRQIRRIGTIGCTIAAIGLVTALYLITRPFPPMPEGRDVFGFAQVEMMACPGQPLLLQCQAHAHGAI